MRCRHFVPVVLCIAVGLCLAARAADDPSADVLKDKGLTLSGSTYVVSDEQPLLEKMKDLRIAKRKADMETRLRKAADAKAAANRKSIEDAHTEYEELNARLERIKDVTAHNRVVTRMNALASRAKEAVAEQKKLEEDANKIGSEAKTKFVDDLLELAPKFDAVAEKYQSLAADAAVKAAIEKAQPKLALGPSKEFATAVADVKKWQSEIDSEAIPLHEEGGVQHVDVIINGERFLMVVDTGAAHLSIPGEIAEKLKMTPGDQDPTIRLQLADGNTIEGKLMQLKTVRVGRFTVENVSCVVLQKGLPSPPIILGDSFLSHFVVKLNQRAGELHLTELKDEKSTARKTVIMRK